MLRYNPNMKNRIWSAGFVAAILLTFSSCMFLGIGSSPSDTGTIEIILGASGRSVVQASQSTTASYLLEITGSDGSKDSRTLSKNAGSYSISLQPGEYTLTITAISADGKESAWDQQNVTVSVGRTIPVAFQLKAGGYVNTSLYLWNKTGDRYALARLESTPANLAIDTSLDFNYPTFAEDKAGNWYCVGYLKDGDGYCDWGSGKKLKCYKSDGTYEEVPLPSSSSLNDELDYNGLNYDASTDTLWLQISDQFFAYRNVSSEGLSEEPVTFKVYFPESYDGVELDNGSSITGFAVCGTTAYIGYSQRIVINGSSTSSRAYYFIASCSFNTDELEYSEDLNWYTTEIKSDSVLHLSTSTVPGKCTDLIVIDDAIYALICDFKLHQRDDDENTFSYDSFQMQDNIDEIHSRGAIIQLSDKNGTLSISRIGGWLPDTKARQYVADIPEGFSVEGYSPTKATIYCPQKTDGRTKFYGPRRFVAIKPKELYIVDCGVNIQLTDWKGGTEGCKPRPGLTFTHSRVVKVDLASFGMSVVSEENLAPDSAVAADIFGAISISGGGNPIGAKLNYYEDPEPILIMKASSGSTYYYASSSFINQNTEGYKWSYSAYTYMGPYDTSVVED